jgi:hypothetical protein
MIDLEETILDSKFSVGDELIGMLPMITSKEMVKLGSM